MTITEIGSYRKRVEDPRLLRGEGQYVDDLQLEHVADVAFLRSAYAHARIARIDVDAARRAPGVLKVWTGEDVRTVPRIPSNARGVKQHHLSPLPPLAWREVSMVGYPLAAVLASSRQLARDAVDLIEVDYEPLPTITSAEQALAPEAPLIFAEFGSNLAYTVTRSGGDVARDLANGEQRLQLRLQHSRLAQVPMEPRTIAARYDRDADRLTVWRSTQSPFGTRAALSVVLGRPETSIRVIAPDVGGAFGAKSNLYPDELATVLLAMEVDRPVRWTSTRGEDLLLTLQGRDQVNFVDAVFTEAGQVTALQVRCVHNLGGVQMHPVATPPMRVVDYATGAYRIKSYHAEGLGVLTTTGPTGPYRGAGRPEAAFVAERTVEEVGRRLGLDPVEVRRRNLIRPDEFPYTNGAGAIYDSGNYEVALHRALEIADYTGLRTRQAQLRSSAVAAGRPAPLFGIGVTTTIEVSGQGQEFGSVEVEPGGGIVARTGSSSHGQGHETSFAQVVADALGVPFETIRVLHGDSDETPNGGGTGGSRSLVVGGGALRASSDGIKDKAIQLAAGLLEVSVEDLAYVNGGVEVVGVPERRLSLAQISAATPGGLRQDGNFGGSGDAVPFGAAVAVVSIDRETGRVKLERLVVVDDCGTVVNPLIVLGQVSGGLAQGVGEALYERMVFGEDGQLLTGSLLEYAVPRADMLPDWELDLVNTPSTTNPLGAKGVGESGCVSAPPAVVNAVLDALAPLGFDPLTMRLDMPLTPEKVWRVIQSLERG
ncbi:MAG: xanthine dehydrogenase family protein molybdopterin-binding subunit [Chloroflexi bacterium]|nr:xanthine dehydrogenase family protein molybdopterin-binding subunit [Chloroflexota bacterium]MBV9598209.1 xanthine dehydrogenase family protein molybdopterin-binding subunit [Chloroflexota bacterium]